MIRTIIQNDYTFSVISRGIGVLTGLLYMILFNRYFGVALKGESAIILNYVTIIAALIDCGVTQSYSYFRKQGSNIKNVYFQNILGVFCLILLIGLLIFFFSDVSLVRMVVMILPFRVLTNQVNSMVAIEIPRKRNYAVIVLNVLEVLILGILIVFTPVTYVIMTVFLFCKELIYLAVALIVAKSKYCFKWSNFKYYGLFVKFGFFSMVCVLLMEINYRVDVLMLQRFVPAEQIGIYSLAVSISERIWLIPDALRDILLSRLSKGSTNEEVAKICRLSFWACIVTMIIAVLIGKPVINFLFGNEYSGSYSVMCLFLFGVLGMIFYKMVYAFFIIQGRQTLNILFLGFTAFSNVIGNIILIPALGINGAVLTSVISYTICGVLYIMAFCRKTKIGIGKMFLIQKEDISYFSHIFDNKN